MRKLYKGEKDSRRVLNGVGRMTSARITRINDERRERLNAGEAQGRVELERKNASISMFSED